jgi:hypothetical protein
VTDEKPLTLYLAYFLSDLTNDTSNEICSSKNTTLSESISIFSQTVVNFFYAVYIFLFVLIENFLLNICTLKERRKNNNSIWGYKVRKCIITESRKTEKSRRSRDFSTSEILLWHLLTVDISHNVFRIIA